MYNQFLLCTVDISIDGATFTVLRTKHSEAKVAPSIDMCSVHNTNWLYIHHWTEKIFLYRTTYVPFLGQKLLWNLPSPLHCKVREIWTECVFYIFASCGMNLTSCFDFHSIFILGFWFDKGITERLDFLFIKKTFVWGASLSF